MKFYVKHVSAILTISILCIVYSNGQQIKNVILIIGDGMGVTQWQSGLIASSDSQNLLKLNNIGFLLTQPSNSFLPDAPSHATAIATGIKTYKGAVAVNMDTMAVKSIIEYAEEHGIATGIVSANTLVEGGIAPFVAHEKNRMGIENIAASYLNHNLDVFIGAGTKFFTERKDRRNLVTELRKKGYQTLFSMDSIRMVTSGKLAGFTARENNSGIAEGRGSMFPDAVHTAIQILNNNKKGFFLLVADVFVDRASHLEKAENVGLEAADLDRAIGKALAFAEKDGNTVVIVAGAPEASGMTLTGGNVKEGTFEAQWAVHGMIHTGEMVPVFAFGPGSDQFRGIQENTALFSKMMDLLRITESKR